MASQRHLTLLRKGKRIWNAWRESHPDEIVDLRSADLSNLSLRGYNFHNADMRYAIISGADFSGANLKAADLRYAKINHAKFTAAKLHKTDFSYADLQAATFCKTELVFANLSNSKLNNAQFVNAFISETRFESATLMGANFSKAFMEHIDLSGLFINDAVFSGAFLRYANLAGTDFDDSDFSDANLSFAKLNNSSLRNCKMCRVDLSQANLDEADLENSDLTRASLENTSLQAANLYRTILNYSYWLNCKVNYATIDACEMRHAFLRGIDFTTVENFRKIDFTAATLRTCNFRKMNLSGCRLDYADLQKSNFFKADLSKVNFEKVNADFANFCGADFSNAKITNSRMEMARFESANFSNCHISQLKAQNTSFRYADFRGSYLCAVDFRGSDLSFAKFDNAKTLGLVLDKGILETAEISGLNIGLNGVWTQPDQVGGVVLPGEKPGKINYLHPSALLNMLKKAEVLNYVGIIITALTVLVAYLNIAMLPVGKTHRLTEIGSWLVGGALLITSLLMLQVYSLLRDVADAVRFLYRPEDLSLVLTYPWYLTRQMSGGGLQMVEFTAMKLIYVFYPLVYAFVFIWVPEWWRLWHAPISGGLVFLVFAVYAVSRGFQKPLVTWNPVLSKPIEVDCKQALSSQED
jgi:uncharacterized protein YjbI with pentapeptide repeats